MRVRGCYRHRVIRVLEIILPLDQANILSMKQAHSRVPNVFFQLTKNIQTVYLFTLSAMHIQRPMENTSSQIVQYVHFQSTNRLGGVNHVKHQLPQIHSMKYLKYRAGTLHCHVVISWSQRVSIISRSLQNSWKISHGKPLNMFELWEIDTGSGDVCFLNARGCVQNRNHRDNKPLGLNHDYYMTFILLRQYQYFSREGRIWCSKREPCHWLIPTLQILLQ